MKTKLFPCLVILALNPAFASVRAASLTQSTFTEVVHDVNAVEQGTRNSQAAKVNLLFKAPDLVRTGPDSRAELTAPDHTITRVGANTVFSFEPSGRDINLERGSVLFHSPSGKGGGTIRSGGASAAVFGTTIIVSAIPGKSPADGNGMKVILLEGQGKVTLRNGRSRTLKAGQMIFVPPGQSDFGPVLDIRLGKLVAGSNLVKGFANELPSIPQVNAAVQRQEAAISSGAASDTGISANSFASQQTTTVANGIGSVDSTSFKSAVLVATPPTTTPEAHGLPGLNPSPVLGPGHVR